MTKKSAFTRILILWSPLADYTVSCLRELATNYAVELHIIYQPAESDAPYAGFDLGFCQSATAYRKEKKQALMKFCLDLQPDVVLMASWNYSFYMAVSKQCKRRGSYVVSAFDNQWSGSFRQRVGIAISSFYLKPAINNFFVPGDRQANFARKLGYHNPLQGYYSANTERFKTNALPTTNKFLFVGRLVEIKGVEKLLAAYKLYRESVKDPWSLIICGTGKLEHLCHSQPGVEYHGFTQPYLLPKKFAEARCFVLPSESEPWGLVIHEAALSGLVIISSSSVGANNYFVRDSQNGYIINPDVRSITHAMKLVSEKDEEELQAMSQISKTLGNLWSTSKWADYVWKNICLKENRFCI